MARGVFITGTDTGVGKTVVTAGLVAALRQAGYEIGAMKPFQSGAYRQGDRLLAPDVEFILEVIKLKADYDLLNPIRLELPLAPSVAAQIEGVKVDIKEVESAYYSLLDYYQALIVEGAGGLMVPLAEDFLIPDLVKLLELPIIIVARPNLGTINHTLLTVEVARNLGLEVLGVILNGLQEEKADLAVETNPQVIEELGEVSILGKIPYIEDLDNNKEELIEVIKDSLELATIIESFSCLSNYKKEELT